MFPAINLEKYFAELTEQNWAVLPINADFALQLQKSAEIKFNSGQFRTAGITNHDTDTSEIRNDSIFWLDSKLTTLSETDNRAIQELTYLMNHLRNYFRVSLNEFECHYSIYPKGHFYKKHRDTTAINNKRVFSFVIYLNDVWRTEDGGELIGYAQEKCLFKITPSLGKIVIFKSDLEHEVSITNRTRYSLAGWFRK